MTPLESLYHAMGELAYSVARVDGTVQKEEKEKFHQLVSEALQKNESSVDVSDIVFRIMEKDRMESGLAYEWAMSQVRLHRQFLTPELKNKFVGVLNKIAEAYPPVTADENELIKKFEKDILAVHRDPVLFE